MAEEPMDEKAHLKFRYAPSSRPNIGLMVCGIILPLAHNEEHSRMNNTLERTVTLDCAVWKLPKLEGLMKGES